MTRGDNKLKIPVVLQKVNLRMEIIVGRKINPIPTDQLVQDLSNLSIDGTLYTGYPILASADDKIFVDALLIAQKYGVVVFHFPSDGLDDSDFWDRIEEDQNALYFGVRQKLADKKELRIGKTLAVEPTIICYLPSRMTVPSDKSLNATTRSELSSFLTSLKPIPQEYIRLVNAAVQRVSTIRPPKKRLSVKKVDSRGAVLKIIEKNINNLDRWQNLAAIESPEGLQCIRGLAGSGKTIVLALKAAYLHACNPEWNIAVTFYTRSLYQQFQDLIRRFSFEHLRDEPDWTKLRIIHAWGSYAEEGIYSEIASAYGIKPKSFAEAKTVYGAGESFSGVCQELFDEIKSKDSIPLYDVLLVDEGQDFPKSFFQLVYHKALRHPQRLAWAYDELQNLGDYDVAPPEELFGVSLHNLEGMPNQDLILPVCYRNTPWALTIAHALGFGIYRDDGFVQLFHDPTGILWRRIGYEIVSGDVVPGHNVKLRRRRDSTPEYFYKLDENDAVQVKVLDNAEDQAKWVAESIINNINNDELEPSDILVIFPNPLSVKRDADLLRNILESRDLSTHIAGITTSRDILFQEDSIAITGIYRAKGNEAPMVYVVNSQYGVPGPELIKRRNTLFTAITRSKAWVRICGYGSLMEELKTEIDRIVKRNYQLEFEVPSQEELTRRRTIYKELTSEDRVQIKSLADIVSRLESGDLSVENIPKGLLDKLKKQIS